MGVLIFTHDAQKYRVGEYVEGSSVLCAPNVEGLTVIVHKRKPTAKECLAWLPHIAYRMVWVCEQPPTMKKNDAVIIDGVFKKNDHKRAIETTMRLRNRRLAFTECATVPVPLMLAFLRENNKDIRLWRRLAQAFTHTPEVFQQAMIAYAHKPVQRMAWPKKKNTDEIELPFGVRDTDLYWERIVRTDTETANDVRINAKETLPKGVKKRVQKNEDGWL